MIHIMEKVKGTIDTPLKSTGSTHRVVLSFLLVMSQEDIAVLQSPKQAFLTTYTEKNMAWTFWRSANIFLDPATASIARTLKHIVLSSLPHLILYHKKRDLDREVNAALTKFVEMED